MVTLPMKFENFEVCMDLFGGASSPSWSNYSLKRTSIDHEKQFGEDVVKYFQRNLYVDKRLKLFVDIETAIDLTNEGKKIV